jgi:hypothetical protein
MAARGSRLEAVLRAGQARLAATGVAPHAKAFWRLSPAQEAARQAQVQAQQAVAAELARLTAPARLRALAHERFVSCLREMTNAQFEFKARLPGALLDAWEEDGREFPDPEAYANQVYEYTVEGEDQKALDLMREGVDKSGSPPVNPQRPAVEAEGAIAILDAWEYDDGDDDDDDDAGVDGDAAPHTRGGRDSADAVAYGLPSDDDDGRGGGPGDAVEESDEAIAWRMHAEWNLRGGGRASRRPPSRMVAGGGGDLPRRSNANV